MRSAVRAHLASHPGLALLLIVARWVLWFLVGHLVGVAVAIMALRVGIPLPVAALVGLIVDLGANLLAWLTDGWIGRRFRLVTLAARFQRRWPAAFAEASQQRPHDRPVILSGQYFAAPDGLRPVLTAPRIRVKPFSTTNESVAWEVRPWSAQTFGEFSADVRLIELADDRVETAHLAGQPPSRRRRWDLTIQFFEVAQDPDFDGGAVESDGLITPGNDEGGGPWPLPEPPTLPNGNGSGRRPHHAQPTPRPEAEV